MNATFQLGMAHRGLDKGIEDGALFFFALRWDYAQVMRKKLACKGLGQKTTALSIRADRRPTLQATGE